MSDESLKQWTAREARSGRFIVRDGVRPVASGKPVTPPKGGSAVAASQKPKRPLTAKAK